MNREQKALIFLKTVFGLSQQWADENIPSTEDLRSIVSRIFDRVLGVKRNGKGIFKTDMPVTDAFSKFCKSDGTLVSKGKIQVRPTVSIVGGNDPTNSVSTFLNDLGVSSNSDDVSRFRALCKYFIVARG